jgi:RHS repeat-associated protein
MRHPRYQWSLLQGLLFTAAVIVVATPSELAATCGPPQATITSLTQSAPDDAGVVTVSVGYDANTWDITWTLDENNPIVYEHFYERQNVPNPYGININMACKTAPVQFKVTAHCTGGDAGETETLSIAVPDYTPKITNLVVTDGASNTSTVSFDYEMLYSNSNKIDVINIPASADKAPGVLWGRPDIYGNGVGYRGTVSFGVPDLTGEVIVRATACTVRALDSTECHSGSCPRDGGPRTTAQAHSKHESDGPSDEVGDPVSVVHGNTTITEQDPLPGTSFFSLTRRFDSRAVSIETVYLFGRHWRSPLDARIVTFNATDQFVTVTDEAGEQYSFVKNGTAYVNLEHDKSDATLRATPAGGWILSDGGLEREFGANARITAYRDVLNGRTVSISYDSSGKPARVDDSWGNWAWLINVNGTTGLIQTITVENQPASVLMYTYTSGKQVQTVSTTAGLFRTYEYHAVWGDGSGYVKTVRDGSGNNLETHTYDSQGRALTSTGPSGDIDLIEYGLAGRQTGERLTRIRWRSGRTELRYQRRANDNRWRTVEIQDGCSSCSGGVVIAYGPGGRVVREQNAAGYVTEYSYDSSGRLTLLRTALAPSGCDPATSSSQCRQAPSALATVALQSTTGTSSTRFERADTLWPEQATLIATASVVNAAVERVNQFAFDPATGNVLTSSTTGLTGNPAVQRTRTVINSLYNGTEGAAFAPGGTFNSSWLSYAQPANALKSVDGPRADVSDATAFVYYPINPAVPGLLRGRVAAQKNALGHITRFESYDTFGNVLRTVDPNGVVFDATFDGLGRNTSTTTNSVAACDSSADPLCGTALTSTRTYLGGGPLSTDQTPGGGVTKYEYDNRARVQAVSRGPSTTDLRERIEYTYDPATGNRSAERMLTREGASWIQKRIESSTFDSLGRLTQQSHADGNTVTYQYEAGGNVASVKDENHTTPNTVYAYDPAGRLARVTQTLSSVSGGVVTTYTYDPHGNLASVTDPNGNVTTYDYDDFGQMIRQTSPVTGVTTYAYDLAGNLLSTTDANGATTTRTYDALSRPTSSSATRSGVTAENVSWTYDAGAFGLGRLSGTTDPSGTTSYAYERRGLLRSESRTIEGNSFTTGFRYDADGNRNAIVYPSGNIVSYTHDHAGRPITASRGSTTLVSSASYLPFGPLTQIVYGNGTTQNVAFDNRYRISTNALTGVAGTIASYSYTHDPAGNITAISDTTDASFNRTFMYDDLHRLTGSTTGESLWSSATYSYDGMGNMLQATIGAQSISFGYSGSTPRLSTVTQGGVVRSVAYHPAGNEAQVGSQQFFYGARNQLSSTSTLGYTYDARGVRVITTDSSSVGVLSLTLSPSTVQSGGSVTATVQLTGAAPSGGATVHVVSSNERVATGPSTVVVASGVSSATFTVATTQVPTDSTAVIYAAIGTSVAPATLNVTAAASLATITAPSQVVGGATATGTATLTTAAPAGGASVQLTSSDVAASVPASVLVSEGAVSASFTISTTAVEQHTPVTITGTFGTTRTAPITVRLTAVDVTALSVKPPTIVGGRMTAEGRVNLSGPAPSGGATIALSSSNTTVLTVPATATAAAGQAVVTFPITTTTVAASTPVTLTATHGVTQTASASVVPCSSSWLADPVTPAANETVWFDDTLPANTVSTGTWTWDLNQKIAGSKSHVSAVNSGLTSHGFYNAYPRIPVYSTVDVITTWVLLDPCNPPREIMFQWYEPWGGTGWNHRAYWGENLIQYGTDGTNSRRRMGDLPPLGQWVRLDVPLGQVGIGPNAPLEGMTFEVYGGRAWFDQTSLVYCTSNPSQPSLPATDVVWFDDAVPPGASTGGTWIWDTARKASGMQSHHSGHTDGENYRSFWGGSHPTLTINQGETLMAYVLIDSCDVPREIMFEWLSGNTAYRTYWGENLMNYGTDGTSSRKRIGDIPASNAWVRLEIPAAEMGMEGVTINAFAVLVRNGNVRVDRVGKAPAGSAALRVPAPMLSSSVTPENRPSRRSRAMSWVRRVFRRNRTTKTPAEPTDPIGLALSANYLDQAGGGGAVRRYSFYTPELQLLAETNVTAGTPTIAHEYVWFNGDPMAQIDVATNTVKWTFTDHLGTPILQTSNTGAVTWRVEREPYGETYAIRAGSNQHQPLALPGQEEEQLGTGSAPTSDRYYNIFRWYRAGWGRYTQSDPLRVQKKIAWREPNLFSYGGQNPGRFTDRLGLYTWAASCDECVNGNKDLGARKSAVDAELPVYCRNVYSYVTDRPLADCMATRCEEGVIECNNNCARVPEIGNRPPGAYTFRGSLADPGDTIWICTNSSNPAYRRGPSGLQVIHEFAHLCGWPDLGGQGVPDPHATGYPSDYTPYLGSR